MSQPDDLGETAGGGAWTVTARQFVTKPFEKNEFEIDSFYALRQARRRDGRLLAFYLAVFGHPGGEKRAATAADIEVPAQLLRDLFDGVTHMDALEIDADAL